MNVPSSDGHNLVDALRSTAVSCEATQFLVESERTAICGKKIVSCLGLRQMISLDKVLVFSLP